MSNVNAILQGVGLGILFYRFHIRKKETKSEGRGYGGIF
jgi:hypothetical protein